MSKFTFPAPDATVAAEDRAVDGVQVRIYTPLNLAPGRPIFVFAHGGGWAMGDLNADDGNCRVISKAAGCVVVSVDYRLSPQFQYPIPLDDCVTVANWVIANGASLGGNGNKIITAGVSAGGNLAIAIALRLIDEEKADKIHGVVAEVPVTIHPDAVPDQYKSLFTSFKEHDKNTINTMSAMNTFHGSLHCK